jgi:hypothetical protein
MPATRSASLFCCDAFSPNASAHSFQNFAITTPLQRKNYQLLTGVVSYKK